jgi:hypothetical protein
MRIYELVSGIQITVSDEEDQIIKKIQTGEKLNDRDDHLAFFLVSRGILKRNGDKYIVIEKPDVWRD